MFVGSKNVAGSTHVSDMISLKLCKMKSFLCLIGLSIALDFCSPGCDSGYSECVISCNGEVDCISVCGRELAECQSECTKAAF